MEKNKNRLIWVDLLRVAATWGVISIHGKSCYEFAVGTYKWVEYVLIGTTATCCVPVFLMLSGYLSLQKCVSIGDTLKRRVPRVVLMKLVSLFLCALCGCLYALFRSQPVLPQIKISLEQWGFGTSYLSVLLGCYLVTPFLYKIIENRELEKYFLLLSVMFCFIVPTFTDLEYVRNVMPHFITSIMEWLDYGQVYLPVGSAALFVLGHYLGAISEKISKREACIFLAIGFITWELSSFWQIANLESTSILSALRYGRYYGSYVAPLLTLYSAAVFVFFKVIFEGGTISFTPRTCRWIRHLGRNSILIFLLHGIVISIFRPMIPVFWVKSFTVETVVDVTIYFGMAFVLSLFLEHIPIIKKIC